MKTQREIIKQREKNEQYLLDQIEKYSGEPASKETIAWLNMCRGAYKAIRMANKTECSAAAENTHGKDRPAKTNKLNGDTEFERVIMTIPADAAHMVKLTSVLNVFLENFKFANARAYNELMDRLREVAKS